MTFTDRVAAYFEARPLAWINALDLERVGGRQAWRTRVSECRTHKGLVIENRCRRVTRPSGEPLTISEYRYVPVLPLLAALDAPVRLDAPDGAGGCGNTG